MSTGVSTTQTSTISPKSVATALKGDEKPPRLHRSSSIEKIKKINTYICSPESYILPAILTTWLKTSQNGLKVSTEKTIFLFRSLIFGSLFHKFLLNGLKSGRPGCRIGKIDAQKVLSRIVFDFFEKISTGSVVSAAFKLAVALLAFQSVVCVYLLTRCAVPLGLGFLLASSSCIIILGYKINRFYCLKRDVKRKNR